jgi:hypothetical protein
MNEFENYCAVTKTNFAPMQDVKQTPPTHNHPNPKTNQKINLKYVHCKKLTITQDKTKEKGDIIDYRKYVN